MLLHFLPPLIRKSEIDQLATAATVCTVVTRCLAKQLAARSAVDVTLPVQLQVLEQRTHRG